MVNAGNSGSIIKYSADDISVIPSDLGTLSLFGASKACITIIGAVTESTNPTEAITLDLALGSSIALPMKDGAIVSNAEIAIKDGIDVSANSIMTYAFDVSGYSELALVKLAVGGSAKIKGTVYIEAVR
nr:MAG TPA: hypothetical protein [Bacteriophage sp.]